MCPPPFMAVHALEQAALRTTVFDALNDAMQQGYDISTWPARDIALDLIAYSDAHESCTEDQLEPHCQAWLDKRPLNDNYTPVKA